MFVRQKNFDDRGSADPPPTFYDILRAPFIIYLVLEKLKSR